MMPCTVYPFSIRNSARYDPSCPVIPAHTQRKAVGEGEHTGAISGKHERLRSPTNRVCVSTPMFEHTRTRRVAITQDQDRFRPHGMDRLSIVNAAIGASSRKSELNTIDMQRNAHKEINNTHSDRNSANGMTQCKLGRRDDATQSHRFQHSFN